MNKPYNILNSIFYEVRRRLYVNKNVRVLQQQQQRRTHHNNTTIAKKKVIFFIYKNPTPSEHG